MKRATVLIFMTLAWFLFPASNLAAAQESPTFTLKLSVANREIRNGEEQVVTVTMTNISNHDIRYGVGGIGPLFRFHVLEEHGNAVKETVRGMKAHGTDPKRLRFAGEVGAALLRSGETVTDKIELGKEYETSAPGVYRVSAYRHDAWSHTDVTSDEVLFTVLPK